MEIEPDSWLSERFGHPLFSLRDFDGDEPDAAATVRGHADAHPAVSYQAKVPTARTRLLDALVGAGLKVVNTAVTLGRDPAESEAQASACEVGEATGEDGEALLDVAERSFWATRFHLDPAVPDEVANRIKRDWVDAYLRCERGDQLLVARVAGRPVGFLAVIAGDGGRVRTIDLTAVDPDHRGAGVGEALARRFLSDSVDKCDHVTVGTQAPNTAAIRLYERLGFEVEDTVYDLHLHLGGAFT